jgi:hypothetical protein
VRNAYHLQPKHSRSITRFTRVASCDYKIRLHCIAILLSSGTCYATSRYVITLRNVTLHYVTLTTLHYVMFLTYCYCLHRDDTFFYSTLPCNWDNLILGSDRDSQMQDRNYYDLHTLKVSNKHGNYSLVNMGLNYIGKVICVKLMFLHWASFILRHKCLFTLFEVASYMIRMVSKW